MIASPLLLTPVQFSVGPLGRPLQPVTFTVSENPDALSAFIHPSASLPLAGIVPTGSRFLVTSESKVKVEAVMGALRNFGPDMGLTVQGKRTVSGVSEQPYGFRETWSGALNRLRDAEGQIAAGEYDFGVSIENGLIPVLVAGKEIYVDVACVVVKHLSRGWRAFALSAGLVVPTEYVEAARSAVDGFRQNTIGSIISQRLGGDHHDPHARLTDGALHREKLLSGAVSAALFHLMGPRSPALALPTEPVGTFLPERFTLDAVTIRHSLARRDFTPDNLISALCQDVFLNAQFDGDPGLSEGYTLREHTLMVLRQYEKYLTKNIPQDFWSFFRLFLALHDIGKTMATSAGDNRLQHHFSGPLAEALYAQLGFSKSDIQLALALLQGDPFGKYVKGFFSAEKAADEITTSARRFGVEPQSFFPIFLTYYMADAVAYTADAGGIPSLDFLFDIDPAAGEMQFAGQVKQKIDHLKTFFA